MSKAMNLDAELLCEFRSPVVRAGVDHDNATIVSGRRLGGRNHMRKMIDCVVRRHHD